MKTFRNGVLLATLWLTIVLIVLSVVGAFLGVEPARVMFNSVPVSIYWILITFLLVIGLVFFKKTVRSPGSLALHVGTIMVLVGAMLGSDHGQEVVAERFGQEKIPSGYMRIFEGKSSRTIHDQKGRTIGKLPFSIHLEDFFIEYYDEASTWTLGVEAPAAEGTRGSRAAKVEWREGSAVDIPFTDSTLEVLSYLPSARPVAAKGGGRFLEIVEAGGKRHVIPAEVGREVQLGAPPAKLTIERIFSHLLVKSGGVVDVPGSNKNPAVKVSLELPDGKTGHRYAFANQMMGHGQDEDGLVLRYKAKASQRAEADPDSGLPAFEILIRRGGKETSRRWLIATSRDRPVVSPLDTRAAASSHGDSHHRAHRSFLVLAPPRATIRQFKSRVVVRDGDRPPVERVIFVNGPLHYGGYHFYQHSYDSEAGRYTVLSVRSDSGLRLVYVGFAHLCIGMFWIFWIRPGWSYLRRGRKSGNQDER